MNIGRRIAAGLVLTLCIGWTVPADAAKRVALVIGNNNYATLPDLANARTDAGGMAAKLKSLGFDVILKRDATRRDISRALAEFESRASNAEVALVFYAGHGIQVGGTNYLVPSNAEIEVEDDLRLEGVGADQFLQAMKRAGTQLNIVILDACRDNPLPQRSRSAARGLAVPVVPSGIKGTAIVYSAAPGQTAQDGPKGGHGVFTGELLRVLGQPGLTLEKIFKLTATRVSAATNGKQDPWINSSVKGDFYFRSAGGQVRKRVTPTAPAEPSGKTMELTFWQSIKDSKQAGDYEAYLAQFPNGTFAGLARSRLATLKPQKVTSPKPPTSTPRMPTQTTAATQETFWQSIKGSSNPADYQDYLTAFPNGTFARLAKRRVSELNRKQVAVRSPSPVRSRRIEKLRGYNIWVQTKTSSLGKKYCNLLSEAGLVVRCSTYKDKNQNKIYLNCGTLPSDTPEIIRDFLGMRNLVVRDWRKHPNYGAKPEYCNEFDAINLEASN